MRSHNEGDIVNGYFFEGGLAGLVVDRSDRRAMAFRIRALDEGARQIRVHPVVALDNGATLLLTCYEPSIAPERWLKAGPTVPLRLEMRMYRWCLSYGEIVMNWQDFLEASNASS